jgi:hypothetical protein
MRSFRPFPPPAGKVRLPSTPPLAPAGIGRAVGPWVLVGVYLGLRPRL